jgi:hypothetical protein
MHMHVRAPLLGGIAIVTSVSRLLHKLKSSFGDETEWV